MTVLIAIYAFMGGVSVGIWIARKFSGRTYHIIENGKFTFRWEKDP